MLCKPVQSLDSLSRLDRVILGWKKTNSLMWSHWAHFVWNGGLRNYIVPTHRCQGQDFHHNLPMEEDESVCRSIYANALVKLTVQIADPYVMVITKDVSATFPDMLGIVGKVFDLEISPDFEFSSPNTGGTIGLFTGLSIITVVETVYWMVKVCFFVQFLYVNLNMYHQLNFFPRPFCISLASTTTTELFGLTIELEQNLEY